MKKLDFNKNWTYRHLVDDGIGGPVTLPHDAMIHEKRSAKAEGKGNVGWFEANDYQYDKTFEVPADYADKHVTLEFEAIHRNSEIYLNDQKLPSLPYGYINQYVEVDGLLNYGGENKLRVIAYNSDQPNSRWYSGAGLFRPAWMYVSEKNHIAIDGVKIKTEKLDKSQTKAKLNLRVKLAGDKAAIADAKNLKIQITDKSGMPVKVKVAEADYTGEEKNFTLVASDVLLWDVDSPNLYDVTVTYLADDGSLYDEVCEQFGIRVVSWDAKTGFMLNGERVILKGGCIHHDHGLLGAAAYPEAEERMIINLKKCGYNSIRIAHNPCAKALLDACDRHGMLICDEYADMWYIHKCRYDYATYMPEMWPTDLKRIVDKDFNHPSVIMYSTGNEVAETGEKRGIELTGQMTEFLHKEDGTRPVTVGVNIFFNFLYSIGFGVYSDEKSAKEAEAAKAEAAKAEQEMAEQEDEQEVEVTPAKKPVGSEFYNVLATKLGDNFMKFGATLYPCDLKTKGSYANLDVAGYNYGLFRYKHDVKKYPNRLILGSETFCKDAYAAYELSKKYPQIIGEYMWPCQEYLGEVGDSSDEFALYAINKPAGPVGAGMGRLNRIGIPGSEIDYVKVAYEVEKGPFLAVSPVNCERANINGWILTKARKSWSYRGLEGTEAEVEVYARAASVKLFLNGKEVGEKKYKKDCKVVFHFPYESGELTAVSYDAQGNEIGRDTLTTASEETLLRVQPESQVAETGKLLYLPIRYTDEAEILKVMEKHVVSIKVENADLLGMDNSCGTISGNFERDNMTTFFGELLAVVRPNGKGDVKVVATDGERTTEVVVPLKK